MNRKKADKINQMEEERYRDEVKRKGENKRKGGGTATQRQRKRTKKEKEPSEAKVAGWTDAQLKFIVSRRKKVERK